MGYMKIGSVPADWRIRRSAVRVALARDAVFLDVEDPQTHEALTFRMAARLAVLDVDRLDVPTVRGPRRDITREISDWACWAFQEDSDIPPYAGIRYLSRINTAWECWAVFEDVDVNPLETKPITLDMPDLQKIAEFYRLQIF